MNCKIRSMQISDVGQILDIAAETKLEFWSVNDYRKEIQQAEKGNSVGYIAEIEIIDGRFEVIGFIVARLIKQDYYVELLNIAVSKIFFGKQIGLSLLKALVNTAENMNFRVILLEVRKSNHRAISFYKKQNFEPIAVRKSFYSNPVEDGITMRKIL